jgi:hypothetical protein
MKRLAVLSIAFLFAVTVVQGQSQKTDKGNTKETKKEMKSDRIALKKLSGNTVNIVATNSFNTDFNGATNVQSKRVETFDEFSFTSKDGQKMKAYYDSDGILVGTTQLMTFTDLPISGQKEIKAKYKDYSVGKVVFYDDNEANSTDMILYGVQFDDADNYFVELSKGTKTIVLQVNTNGNIFLFKEL